MRCSCVLGFRAAAAPWGREPREDQPDGTPSTPRCPMSTGTPGPTPPATGTDRYGRRAEARNTRAPRRPTTRPRHPQHRTGKTRGPATPRPSYHSPHVAEAFQLGPSRGARRQIRRQVRRRCADHRHLLPAVVRRPAAAPAQRAHVQDGRRGARGRTSALQALPPRSFLSRRRQRHRIVRRARRARAHRARACPRHGGARARLRREPNQAQRPHARAGAHDPGGVAQARARPFGLPGAPSSRKSAWSTWASRPASKANRRFTGNSSRRRG